MPLQHSHQLSDQDYDRRVKVRHNAGRLLTLLAGLMLAGSLTGCLLIGGSSRGGFFIFPGGLGLVVIIVVVAMLLRRR